MRGLVCQQPLRATLTPKILKRVVMVLVGRQIAAVRHEIVLMNTTMSPRPDDAIKIAPGVHWIGALDPDLRTFNITLKTATGTSYNPYAVPSSDGVAVIDTVKACFSNDFFRRLESVARYDEIHAIVLNHLEQDHSGALPELLRRAPQAQLYISTRAKPILMGLLHGGDLTFTPVKTGDTLSLGDRTLSFLNTLTSIRRIHNALG